MKKTQAKDLPEKIVDQWICIFGIPEQILTDGGTQYRSILLEAVYEYLDINSLKTTPYHPEWNGESERTVQTVKNMIRSYCDEDQNNWDLNLQKIAFAYNTSVHATTKKTPFKLQFGRDPVVPIDILLPNTKLDERETILEEHMVNDEQFGKVMQLEDLDIKYFEKKIDLK